MRENDVQVVEVDQSFDDIQATLGAWEAILVVIGREAINQVHLGIDCYNAALLAAGRGTCKSKVCVTRHSARRAVRDVS